MPRSLTQIQKQIAKLEAQANAIKRREVAAVIDRIKEAIAFYGLTASDLGLQGRPGRPAANGTAPRTTRRTGKSRGKIKFQDDAGNAWTGHGRRPKWYVDAIAAGKTPEQLAV